MFVTVLSPELDSAIIVNQKLGTVVLRDVLWSIVFSLFSLIVAETPAIRGGSEHNTTFALIDVDGVSAQSECSCGKDEVSHFYLKL